MSAIENPNNTNQNNDIIEEKIENGSNNEKPENKEYKRGNYKFIKRFNF